MTVTDEMIEALARFLSEQPDGMERDYCTDDGLSVPANTPEWTLRADFARAALTAMEDRMGWRERDVAKIRRVYVNREAHLRAVVTRLTNRP